MFLNTMRGMINSINKCTLWRPMVINLYATSTDDNEHTRFRKKPALGSRYINEKSEIFQFNAWYFCDDFCDIFYFYFKFIFSSFTKKRDNVEWDEELEANAKTSVEHNSNVTLSEDQLQKYEEDADQYWDSFYNIHQNR